ncbi:MAG: hypothetical protein HUU06_12250 [Planctomycetaceae bacterium]|nr:hypothetical protein [Planctomycetota bacterium]NUN53542.1 hypothetical protein [Planctomycetaceae bacterium]
MHGLTCDRCGKNLLVDEEVRYLLRLEIVAAYDPPEIMPADLERDFDAEIRRLVRSMEGRDAVELEEEVAAVRRFDLCPPCRRALLADPLGGGGGGAPKVS